MKHIYRVISNLAQFFWVTLQYEGLKKYFGRKLIYFFHLYSNLYIEPIRPIIGMGPIIGMTV